MLHDDLGLGDSAALQQAQDHSDHRLRDGETRELFGTEGLIPGRKGSAIEAALLSGGA